jgi:hydroxymethylpyrimidine/phosphomethylpyrimidine kinase
MSRRARLPIALTVAGSDSGGGAGIQADLKTFAALGVHGTSAITCITAQNPRRVTGIQAIRPDMVRAQIEAVFAELPPAAVKTGMLFSEEIIRVVAEFFRSGCAISSPSPPKKEERVGGRRPIIFKLKSPHPGPLPAQAGRGRRYIPPLVVDPVMVSTSGARLLKPSAIKMLKEKLLPLATLATPNLDEAEILTGRKLRSPEDLRVAARQIHEQFGCAVLVKGGHLRHLREAVDVFFDGRTEWLLRAPFVRGVSTHGTGCTYSAAVAGCLALGHKLPRAVMLAKRFVTAAIENSYGAAGHTVLNHGG